jgi:hypothetical protein
MAANSCREMVNTLHRKDFAKLDQRTQDFASQLAAGFAKTDELSRNESVLTRGLIVDECDKTRIGFHSHLDNTRGEIATESKKTRDLIDHRLDELQDTRLDSVFQEKFHRFLKSLTFPEMKARYNDIIPSHKSTFEWLYGARDKSDNGSSITTAHDRLRQHCDTFSKWLSSNESLFWVNGKPGSGKSTLMKFLLEHSRTQELLREQHPSTLIISHFIWNAGSYFQRSQKSLLSSLLHQLLSHRADVARVLLEEDGTLQQKVSHSDWSREGLESVLFKAVHLLQCSTCIFIDGLDEIDQADGDGLYELLGLIHRLRSLPNLRFCVSSRPEALIRKQLESYPNMRLQDLTRHDMHKYILDTITPEWEKASFLQPSNETVSSLSKIILGKADGIFLWVRLVVSSIRNGLIKYDNWEILLERINALPSKISDLYNDMWKRLNGDMELYRTKSALYFKLLLYQPPYVVDFSPKADTLLLMLLASDLSLQQSFLEGGVHVSEHNLAKECCIFQQQLLSRCAGFVEIADHPGGIEKRSVWSRLKFWRHARVRFIHKSAADFLLDTLDGQKLLQHDSIPVPELFVLSMLSNLISRVLLDVFEEDSQLYKIMFKFTRMTMCGDVPDTLWDLYHQSFVDLIGMTLKRIPEWTVSRLEFVPIAAELSLCDYVKKQLRERPPPEDLSPCEWKNVLLGHASMGHRDQSTVYLGEDNLELISWLLDEGADPNSSVCDIRLSGQTPFHCFLLTLQHGVVDGTEEEMGQLSARALMRVLRHFLDRGADVNVSLFTQLDVPDCVFHFHRHRFPYWANPRSNEFEEEEEEELGCLEDESKSEEELGSREELGWLEEDLQLEEEYACLEDESNSEEELRSREELGWLEDESELEEDLRSEEVYLKKELELEGKPRSRLNLFVEIERACVDLYQELRAFLKDKNEEETQDEQFKELLATSRASRMRVKLITRTLEGSRSHRFNSFSSKVVALEEESDHLIAKAGHSQPQPSLLEAYQNISSPEMNERETLEWMIRNGYLASDFLRCANPLDVLFDNDHLANEWPPIRKGFSGVDFSFHHEYSKLMEVVSQFPKEQDGMRGFVDFCNRFRWPKS